MKVAIVSPYDLAVPGGVQAHVRELAERLRRTGDEVVVLGPRRTFRLRFNGSVAPIALAPAAYRAVGRALRRIAPDVVHVHEPLVPWIGLAAATFEDAPVVATYHAWSERDTLYRLARPVARKLFDRVAVAIAVSPAAADYHSRALGVAASRFQIVPNGVDVARFASASPMIGSHDPTRPTLVFVGRLEPRKGLRVLLDAFVRLRTIHPDLQVLVAGDGEERERALAAVPEPLRHDVHLLGRVDTEVLPQVYAAADVYVSPALGGESFGIVLLEAMAAGKAVVASNIPGYRSVLTDGEQGKLVPPADAQALAYAIDRYLTDPALRRRAGEAGRNSAAAYDWQVVASKIRALYEAASRSSDRI